jgi:hypothetical protein
VAALQGHENRNEPLSAHGLVHWTVAELLRCRRQKA